MWTWFTYATSMLSARKCSYVCQIKIKEQKGENENEKKNTCFLLTRDMPGKNN